MSNDDITVLLPGELTSEDKRRMKRLVRRLNRATMIYHMRQRRVYKRLTNSTNYLKLNQYAITYQN